MRAKRTKNADRKYSVGEAVTLSYHAWSPSEWSWPVAAEIAEAANFAGDPREFYLLRILDVSELDKTDRCALEGPERNLFGWVSAESIGPR